MSTAAQATSSSGSVLSANRSVGGLSAQFREIHKNTWLKRLTPDGRKVTVGPKKSERSWVVFCVHDDTEALLEGYAEPRQAASHNPEWQITLQNTLHISHALIPNSNEFEFVVTLSTEVIRFHAMSWEVMQEWVETLRSKLREMKIISPRENLYTKLPESRPPLLPTRDPTSPLPAPPPVPAAIVPGVEIVVPQSILQQQQQSALNETPTRTPNLSTATTTATSTSVTNSSAATALTPPTHSSHIPAMSNTLTQNLLNMLSDPISTYSEQLNASESLSASENISTSLNDLQICDSDEGEDDDCLSPLMRPTNEISRSSNETPIKVHGIETASSSKRHSADNLKCTNSLVLSDHLLTRPHTSRSHSAGAADHRAPATNVINSLQSSNINITELEITSPKSNVTVTAATSSVATSSSSSSNQLMDQEEQTRTNITIIRVSDDASCVTQPTHEVLPALPAKISTPKAAEVFKFPEMNDNSKVNTKQQEYRSNVQLIPSNNNANSSTIKVLGDISSSSSTSISASNQYSTPAKKQNSSPSTFASSVQTESNKITTVHVGGNASASCVSVYGTCYNEQINAVAAQAPPVLTPKLRKKIILSANTSGVTNITVDVTTNNSAISKLPLQNTEDERSHDTASAVRCNVGNVHYEKVFLSSSAPIPSTSNAAAASDIIIDSSNAASSTDVKANSSTKSSVAPGSPRNLVSPRRIKQMPTNSNSANHNEPLSPITTAQVANLCLSNQKVNKTVQSKTNSTITATTTTTAEITPQTSRGHGSPALQRRGVILRPPNMLTRGQTEAVITTRPSRRDLYFANNSNLQQISRNAPTHANASSHKQQQQQQQQHQHQPQQQLHSATSNNNENGGGDSTTLSENSTGTQGVTNRNIADVIDQRRRSSSTSDARVQRTTRGTNNNEFSGNNRPVGHIRLQQPPHPLRNMENSLIGNNSAMVGGNNMASPSASGASKRLTIREQQVMQLRREIMHPGGVRLKLRLKDCNGSIAWVEAFGAVWVAGWKQKEHPVLYNALHIGDQLLSIAGITISSAAEANKIIRNANTLFVEVLIRRIPFGRGYAIRRDREGQCLGLIRDGNTATIVDVVPNSLAARHGLPPKAQSCDGATLTFWVLTEINSRPLNLFFKDNEIRDRLNSVGRDISILVQPADLVTKLKKQLKSLRGYKDYLVQ